MRIRLILTIVILIHHFSGIGQGKPHYSIIENRGQWPSGIIGAADLESGKLFLEEGRLTYHFFDLSAIRKAHFEGYEPKPSDTRIKGHVYRMNFMNSSSQLKVLENSKLPTTFNYFLDKNPAHWASACSAFGEMTLVDLYPGIDFKLYSQDFFLKYDLIVHAGADASNIAFEFEGCDDVSLESGRLKIITSVNTVWEQKPIAWQIINGAKKMIACEYDLKGNKVQFKFPKGFDSAYDLIIDPEIVFSTFSGSTSDNFGYTATYDEDGYLYSGSSAFGQGYPTTVGAYQTTHQGGDSSIEEGIDMALSKYDVSGTTMVWSTFLGGSGDDLPHSIITNSLGELMVYGSTGSFDFPTTANAIDQSFNGGSLVSPSGTGANFPNGSDIVVAHFNADCTELLGSTYLGGSANDGVCTSAALKHNYADEFRGEISLDNEENILIVSSTFSIDFPVENAVQPVHGGSQDALIAKLSPGLSAMLWGTFVGGSGDDSGFSVSNNSTGELYMCGGTTSSNMPVSNNAAQSTTNGGLAEGYIMRFSADGQQILNGTYWGSIEYDQLYFIEIDNENLVYVFGQTTADDSAMIINATYGTPNSGNIITKFNPDLTSVIWSTVFGTGNGKPNLSPSAFLVDYCNRIYISGWGITTVANNPLNPGQNLHSMNNMEVTSDAFDNLCTTGDFYMAVFDENMTTLEYGTFFGGGTSSEHVDGGTSRFDRKGVIYQSVCAGCGSNSDFPIYPDNAWSPLNNSSCNNGVYKFDFQLPLTVADFEASPTGCVNVPIQFTNSSTYALTYAWDFGDETTSNVPNPQHAYAAPGIYEVQLMVTHNATCNANDTLVQTIEILAPITDNLSDIILCEEEDALLGPTDVDDSYDYNWSPDVYLNNNTVPNPTFENGVTTDYTLMVQHDGCTDVYHQLVEVTELILEIPNDTTICDEQLITLTALYSPADAAIIWSDEPDFSNVLNDNTTDADISLNIVVPTTFYVSIEKNGCELIEEVNVNLVSFQTIIEGDFTACENDTVELSVLSPNPDFIYTWTPEDLIITGQNTPQVSVFVPAETTFFVNATTPSGCPASDEVTVAVSDLSDGSLIATATPEIVVQGQSTQLNALPDGLSYEWTPSVWLNDDDIQSPVASPEETITYFVTAFDGECSAQASVRVSVVDFICGPPSIYVPNVFTPNEDGHNEKLFVRGNNISKLYFVLYDRWGEKVFETTKMEAGWDGKYEGREVDPDVYVYYLEATCIGGQDYFEEGNITVVR